jgi:threonine dehydrogenase-like Zn-dependent dehydrogenase
MQTVGLYYVEPHRVELREFELGAPDLYEVQIELKASGLCAWDLHLFDGGLSGAMRYPLLHGHEGAGVVTAVGERVHAFKPGDPVTAMGNDSALLGRHANVPQQYVAKLPQGVTAFEHWIAEPVACVMNGLEWSRLVPGDRVAVVGTGFMGLLLVQGLAYSLVSEIIAIDVDDERLAMAETFGADRSINAATDKGHAQIEALAGEPVDVVIECAGNQAGFDIANAIVRRGGRLNIFSAQRGDPRQVSLSRWHSLGVQAYASSPSIAPDFPSILARTVPMMARGVFDLEPLVTHISPPEQAQELFELALARRDGYIKGVIRW